MKFLSHVGAGSASPLLNYYPNQCRIFFDNPSESPKCYQKLRSKVQMLSWQAFHKCNEIISLILNLHTIIHFLFKHFILIIWYGMVAFDLFIY